MSHGDDVPQEDELQDKAKDWVQDTPGIMILERIINKPIEQVSFSLFIACFFLLFR